MAQERTKFSFKEMIFSARTIVEDTNIWESNVLKLVVENAGATNEIKVYGRISPQTDFILIDNLIGNGTKTFDIELYDFVKVTCEAFDSASHVLVSGSAFTTPNTVGTVNVSVTNESSATNPAVYNVSMVSSATEYSFTIPSGAKSFVLKDRDYSSTLKLSFVLNGTSGTYITLPRGCNYQDGDLNLTTTKNIYLKSDKNNVTVELIVWT